ncbi:5-hydroxytryptamine receptor 3A-like isoform X1 [Hippoglossus hippoglossus]|uniref:5-hydroxytryptamine receptor 3A-like isoform X1 n=1 Tax=Hippoglossus hippoglossus TaxID=8267 RepID=UPI00148C15E5|nr:5-hydroxytryptamine receptor 3A-like isoform X1 [Hippoglossus hippoglossus]
MTSKGVTLKWLFPFVTSTLVVFVILMPAPCSAIMVNCSQPNQPALLEALTPIFNLSAIRPVMNMTTCTNIKIFFTLYGILGVDEKAQLLTTYLWLHYWWINELVSWDPVECGTNKITLPRDKFWIPDIVINEFMDENTAPTVPYLNLYSNGWMHDAYPAKVVSSCNLDIYNFPFDIQNCTLTFNSYIHYATDIIIFLNKSMDHITEHSKDVMTTLGEWELLDITSNKHTLEFADGEVIDELAFHIRLRRRATLYVVNLLIPSCFLITVDLFSFLLPPQAVDRSSFKMTLILGYTVFLLMMNDLLPSTGNSIPLINIFFSLCLALMVASLLETIFITNLLCGSANVSPVPHWIQVLVLQILGCLVPLPQKVKDSDTKRSAAVAKREEPRDERGPLVEDKAVQELRSLGKDLQALRLQVEQQLGGTSSSEEWIQCCQRKVKPSKLLFIFIFVLMNAESSSLMMNCSQPDAPSLLEALKPVFKLSAIRPVRNISTITHVNISFTLYGILGVDEKAQILTTLIWQSLSWRNEFILWDPQQCGSSSITVPRKLLWVPDVVINEFMEKNSAPFTPYTYVYYDGLVFDAQPVRVVSSCRLDIYKFPFDVQNCSLSFNSYAYLKSALQINLPRPAGEIFEMSKEMMATMGEWELIGITVEKLVFNANNEEVYEELRFYVSLKRRATLYVVNLLIPSCFLITVDLFSFLLPPQTVDRSSFKMTLILGYTVFLLIMNDLLPVTGNSIPLINVFLSLCLGLMVASLLETILITNLLCGSTHYSAVPHWIRVLVLRILGQLVRLPPKSRDLQDVTVIQNPSAHEMKVSSVVEEDSEAPEQKGPLNKDKALDELRSLGKELQGLRLRVEQHLGGSQSSEEWIQVGFIIDRLLFGLYVLFISVSFITIIIIWVQSYNP